MTVGQSTTPDHGALQQDSPSASGLRFWGTAYTLLILLTGTNVATPLYHGYAQRFGFSPLVMTLVFAVYMGVLIPSLLIAGPASDAVGRRRILLPALALAALGSAGFALASNVVWLFAARILQGLAVGAASGALTAALTELEPHGDRRRAALVSAVASAGGMGVGPLLGAVLAQYLPAPYVTPFAVELALSVPAVVAVATLPQTRVASRWRPRHPSIPVGMGALFAAAGTGAFLGFAVVGVFLTLIPTYAATLSGSANLVIGGAAAALLPAAWAVAQLLGYGRSERALEFTGFPLLAIGLAALAVAGSISSLPLLLCATVLAGAGHGLVFLSGLTAINAAAPVERHADVLSTYFVMAYCGSGGPVIGVGLLAGATGLLSAVQIFATAVAVLCVLRLIIGAVVALGREWRR
ncbi:MFS transporter [Nocardia aurantiaca]|uniref:MFS transporter n=1 Tax=Nocardia aurantiaca TaxID=2675850 RepID=A0A6I3L3G1_9NOCA|nr:MFS transporter [Nocardia aurantiaca]MTE16367.1 MFS transporter [Nocardia aurantiaca]